jgi:hypothetical protein
MPMPTKDEVLDLISKHPNGYANTLRFKHKEFMEHIGRNKGSSIGEKLYRWLNPDTNPACKLCGGKTNFKQLSKGYFDFCSSSCRAKAFESFKNGASQSAVAKREKWRASLSNEDKARLTSNSIFRDKEKREEITRKRVIRNIGQEAYDKLHSKEWLSGEYKTKTVSTIAAELGVKTDVVANAIRRFSLISPRVFKASYQERAIRDFLVNDLKIPDSDIESNVKHVIPPKELDIYIPSKGIAIEFCGAYWHSDSNEYTSKPKGYHQQKMLECQTKGIKLLTIWDLDWNRIPDVVKSMIRNALDKNTIVIQADRCSIRFVGNAESKDFLEKNHHQGDEISNIQLGLYHEGQLVSVMTFSKPEYDTRYQWEVVRAANLSGISVLGWFSKLIKHFRSITSTESIVAYSDNCWGHDQCYSEAGFYFAGITDPSCFYFKTSGVRNGVKHHGRRSSERIAASKESSSELNEKKIMKQMGYYRVWDCGESVWVYSKGALTGSWSDVWA